MARRKTNYTREELREASDRVMRSLNVINKNAKKTRIDSAIPNSLGKPAISKSAQRRRNRKEKANIGGKSLDDILETLPEPEKPKTVAAINTNTQKAKQKLVQHEIKNYGKLAGLSMTDIKAQIQAKQQQEKTEAELEKLNNAS